MNRELHGLKLRAIVRDQLASVGEPRLDGPKASAAPKAAEMSEPVDIGVGAAVLVGSDAWVLVEDGHDRALGVGLAWMHKSNARKLNLLVGERSGVLARRAANFAVDIAVWEVVGRSLIRAVPLDHLPEMEPRASHLEFGAMILDSGADVVIEHGVVGGEVVGLEVCRVVDDQSTGEPRLEIGVGVHDREAFAQLHGRTPLKESLGRIVDVVRRHRREDADPHPLNRLAAERALRSRILSDPSTIGAVNLRAVSTPSPRANLKDPSPCAALGETASGEPLVAVFSSGIDLDVVPASADTRTWLGQADAHLVIVVPERDASPITRRLADALRSPATLIGVPNGNTA